MNCCMHCPPSQSWQTNSSIFVVVVCFFLSFFFLFFLSVYLLSFSLSLLRGCIWTQFILIKYYTFLKLSSLWSKCSRSKYLPYLYILIHIFTIRITWLMARTLLLFSVSFYPNKTSFNFNVMNLLNFKYAYSLTFFPN